MAKQVRFSDLQIGEKFGCWGDIFINYDYPKWCICSKISENSAEEINGISFIVNKNDYVTLL